MQQDDSKTPATKGDLKLLATKDELQEAVKKLATKDELQEAVKKLATKDELQNMEERILRHFDVKVETIR